MEKMTYRIRQSILFVILGIVLLSSFTWWLLNNTTDWPTSMQFITSVFLGAIGGVGLAQRLFRPVTESVEAVITTLKHFDSNPTDMPPVTSKDPHTVEMIQHIYNIAASAHSITESTSSERDFLHTLLDLMPVGILAFDTKQELVFINHNGSLSLGVKDSELIGLEQHRIMDWEFQTDITYDVWLEQVRMSKIRTTKLWERVNIIKKDGVRVIGDCLALYEKDAHEGLETIVVFIDRTSQYVADEAQLDFVAVAAHELRGPITIIRGYLDVFKQELAQSFTVEQQLLLQKMTVSAEMLSLYVNNILNVARVDQRTMQLHLVKSDWQEVIQTAFQELSLRAQARGRILRLELPNQLPSVAVDRVSIVEVLNNLIDNAIKYSSEGGEIIISVKEKEGLVETTVRDFGIGISESVIGNLFKKFYRSHKTRTGVSGTGLGLYLSKVIIDAHGGNIWVSSQEGQGSLFGFDLPTYDTIADSLKKGDNSGQDIKRSSHGWIKNHSMYRR